jgi:hypothetical protein
MIPPSKNPSAKVNPGISATETTATTQEVRITIGKAKLAMILRYFQNSFQDTCHDASYNSGGRKIKNTRLGLIVTFPKAGMKLIATPPKTRTIGYAIRNLFATITSPRMIMIRYTYSINVLCI